MTDLTEDQERLKLNADMLSALGARWRGDWSDFDGRTLRDQLDEVTEITSLSDLGAARTAAKEFIAHQDSVNEW